MDGERQMERQKRAREPFIKVVASAAERAEIKRLAGAARMSVSAYLRTLGLSWIPKSTLDCQAVLALARINADQGRLGGLLKMWLSERPGEGAPTIDVRRLLKEIEDTQVELRATFRTLKC
jgi:hypothetical protein